MKRKVLLVEDDAALRKALSVVLVNNGHEVMEADTVKQGLEKAPGADIVLLDLKLGNENGEVFLDQFRRGGHYAPVIVLSGAYPKAETFESLRKYKIVDFVEKPFKTAELLGKVGLAGKVAEDIKVVSEAPSRFKAAAESIKEFIKLA